MDIVSRFEFIAQRNPQKVAFIQESTKTTYSELRTNALSYANRLTDLGLGQGDRCLVLSKNDVKIAELLIALWYCRAIPVIINQQSAPSQLQHAINITNSTLAITEEANQTNVSPDVRAYGIDEIFQSPSSIKRPAPFSIRSHGQNSNDVASIVFTSGSSGAPKGVAQTHNSLLSGCQTVFQYLNYTEDDKILCPVPWSFDYGFGQLLTTLLMGVTQIVCPTNDPFTICDLIQVEKPDILAGTPSFYSTICQGFSPINNVDTSTIRLLTSTGSKFHQTTLEAVEHSFPTSEISLNYGLTETYRSASLPPKYVKTHPASVGFSIPGVELLVVRDDGTLADANETGEIVHRGTGVFKGYWGDPESTAKVLKPDPVHIRGSFDRTNVVYTGDLGRVDDDGFIFLEGRRDRLIKSMGVRVSPDEIEDILVQNTKIVEAAVFKKPHPVVGDLIVAVFTSKDKDVDQKKLKDYCRNSMSPFMMPREFHQLPSIPRTVNGKTDYKTLADTI